MKNASSCIFSAQAVLISFVLHVVVVGTLFSLGRSQSKAELENGAKPAAESPTQELADASGEKTKSSAESVVEKPRAQQVASQTKAPESAVKTPSDAPVEIKIIPQKAQAAKTTPAKSDENANSAPKKDVQVYVVKSGDTLTALARGCGLTISELAALNGTSVKKLSNLKVGQKLKIVKN